MSSGWIQSLDRCPREIQAQVFACWDYYDLNNAQYVSKIYYEIFNRADNEFHAGAWKTVLERLSIRLITPVEIQKGQDVVYTKKNFIACLKKSCGLVLRMLDTHLHSYQRLARNPDIFAQQAIIENFIMRCTNEETVANNEDTVAKIFLHACRHGDLFYLEFLLKSQKKSYLAQGPSSVALPNAVENGYHLVVEMLLRRECFPTSGNNNPDSKILGLGLLQAVRARDLHMINLFAGFDVGYRSNQIGLEALQQADIEICKTIFNRSDILTSDNALTYLKALRNIRDSLKRDVFESIRDLLYPKVIKVLTEAIQSCALKMNLEFKRLYTDRLNEVNALGNSLF